MKIPGLNNISIVQRLYQARGDATVIREVLDRNVRWEVVEGFPYSDVYLGPDDVLGRFFARLFADFEDWHTEPNEFFQVENRVIALGTYSARAKATGRTFQALRARVDYPRRRHRPASALCRHRANRESVGQRLQRKKMTV
jgi:hypothetical protein